MVFTTLTLLAWAVAFGTIGIVVGWMLRGARSRDEVAAARAEIFDDDSVEQMHMRLVRLERVGEERDRLRSELSIAQRDHAANVAHAMLFGSASSEHGPIDDLTLVRGIGPRIAELLHDADISTWADLADADEPGLRTILESAGSRFKLHDPSRWPHQAALLRDGRWDEFSDLLADLDRHG